MDSIWPALQNNLTHHLYFLISDVPRAPVSSSWWRRAAAPTASAQRRVIAEAQPPGSTRHEWDKCWIFPLRPPPQTETTGMDEGESEHPTPKPHITQERGTAPPQGWQPWLRLFYIRCSYRAQQELCLRSCEGPVPGLLPHLTLQITDDNRAECSTAQVTDLPRFPTRSRHYQHLTGLIPAHTSNAKLHLPVCSPW